MATYSNFLYTVSMWSLISSYCVLVHLPMKCSYLLRIPWHQNYQVVCLMKRSLSSTQKPHNRKNYDSSVGIVTTIKVGRPRIDSRQEQWRKFLSLLLRADRLWGPPSLLTNSFRGLSSGVKRQGIKLTTHLHVVPRLKMRGAIPSLHHTSSWRGA
jgi:hypothetical protein